MKHPLAIAFSLPITLCLMASPSITAASSIYTELDSFSLSEPQPIYETIKDWQGHYEGGDFAETFNRFELGFRWHNWRVGYVARYDYRMNFSRDTALFYYQEKNDLTPESDYVYDVDIEAYHQSSQGIAFHYDWRPLEQLTLTGSFAVLQARALIDGRLSGQAQYLAGGRYGGNLSLDYQYTEDAIFARPLSGDHSANGYTFDIALDYRPNEQSRLYARTRDLIGRFYWDEAPRTVARAQVAARTTEDPFEFYKRAAISGTESYRDFVQHLPQRFEFGGSYQWHQWRFAVDTFVHPDQVYVLPRVERLYDAWTFSLLAEPQLGALGVGVAASNFYLELVSDSLSYERAHFLKLSIGARIDF